jgi:hypothetical protein
MRLMTYGWQYLPGPTPLRARTPPFPSDLTRDSRPWTAAAAAAGAMDAAMQGPAGPHGYNGLKTRLELSLKRVLDSFVPVCT